MQLQTQHYDVLINIVEANMDDFLVVLRKWILRHSTVVEQHPKVDRQKDVDEEIN